MKFGLRKFLPRTLFGRSLLILITPILLIQVVMVFVFFDRHWDNLTRRLAYAVSGEIALIARVLEEEPKAATDIAAYASQSLGLLVGFEPKGVLDQTQKNQDGVLLEAQVANTLSREIKVTVRRPFVLNMNAAENWVEVLVQLSNGILRVSFSQKRLFTSSGYIFLLWVSACSLLLLALAIVFMRNQIRPIHRLAVAADLLGKGRDVAAFKPQGAREVRQAAEAFLRMRERIQRQVGQRTAMLAGVSHDLRTPLTRLKLQLAMMGDTADILAMRGDIADMEKMIEGYLDFVRGEGGEQTMLVSVNERLEGCVQSLLRQGCAVAFTPLVQDVRMMLRPMAFERCLMNVLGNAAKYAGQIWMEVHASPEEVRILIDDDGPGIPQGMHDEVFKPFIRVESSRNPQTGGVGLGLPIAMDIVHAHGGEIALSQSPHGGLRVSITLPR